jgi:hypothetical protein
MKFVIPKINTEYSILRNLNFIVKTVDSVGRKRLVKHGIKRDDTFDFMCILDSGAIFKIRTWYPMYPYVNIRVVSNPNKPFEKFNCYIYEIDEFFKKLDVEEVEKVV